MARKGYRIFKIFETLVIILNFNPVDMWYNKYVTLTGYLISEISTYLLFSFNSFAENLSF